VLAKQTHMESFYQHEGDTLRVFSTIEPQNRKATQESYLFVLDNSGSMCNNWHQVQTAVKYMIDSSIPNVSYIIYNSTAKEVTADQVLREGANGGTSFEAAFQAIQTFISRRKLDERIAVIFMTDGDDTSSRNLKTNQNLFTAFIKSCRRHVTIHTIGYGKSHQRNFLEQIRTFGSQEGVYRYAEDSGLDTKFEEIFDFLVVTKSIKAKIGASEQECPATLTTEGLLELDLIFSKAIVDPQGKLFSETNEPIMIVLDGVSMEIPYKEPDAFFHLRQIEEMVITTPKELELAQVSLSLLVPQKSTKEQRTKFLESRMLVQEKLDKFHALFASISRGLVQGDNIVAQLNSLRHETTFSKARRARAMDQRIVKNTDILLEIDSLLEALPAPDISKFKDLDLTCGLSSSHISEIMADSKSDFMVFPLRIVRPEVAIDAPSLITVEKFLIGTYSSESFQQSARYSIQNQGSTGKALGGFVGNFTKSLDEAVGLFRGADGELVNACLPLYINEEHWARVKIQLNPILGYFFTMDPLGFRGDQIIAVYAVLGSMLAAKAHGKFTSEYADWVLADFTKLCTAMLPMALEYLQTGPTFDGVQADLVEEFHRSGFARSKQVIQNLMVIVGWNYCTKFRENNLETFDIAFVEELWRRNLGYYFHGQPRDQINVWLEELLFAPLTDNAEVAGETLRKKDLKTSDKEFANFAKGTLGVLSKAKTEEVLKKTPACKGLIDSSASFQPRSLVVYEEHSERLDAIVKTVLALIEKENSFIAPLFDQKPLGVNLPGKTKWLMIIQALRYSSNSLMNEACTKGTFKNTYDCVIHGTVSQADLVQELFEDFERHRKENSDAYIRAKNDLAVAKQIVMSGDVWAFAGKLLVYAPTRGGNIFNCIVGLLSAGQVDGEKIPLIFDKIYAVMTGKISVADTKYEVLSKGTSWVHCSVETARKLKDQLEDADWSTIENSMYGTWGWVYRESDIPNRHGHCNSNPNTALSSSFRSFNL